MLTDEMKAAGWIKHDGGPCPVAANHAPAVITKSGSAFTGRAACYAGIIDWSCVIAYKPENSRGTD